MPRAGEQADMLPGADQLPVTLEDMRRELTREKAQRERVYRRLLASGQMTPAQAKWRARCLDGIEQALDELERLGGWPPGQMQG